MTATRALVIGLGRSGVAAVEALTGAGVEVVATDLNPDVAGIEAARRVGADVRPATDPDPIIATVQLVVPSPGVPEHAPALVRALAAGIDVWSEPELGWRLHPRRVVGITGTNGKTTVTELVAAMLTAGGIAAEACGNIGTPFTAAAGRSTPDTVLVAELSSFQLRFTHTLRPEVAVLLNVAADHEDWHGDAGAYAAAKARLWAAQRDGDLVVASADDPGAVALGRGLGERRVPFSGSRPLEAPGCWLDGGQLILATPEPRPVVAVADLPSAAPHDVANIAAAMLAAALAGAPDDALAAVAREYRPGRHRIEVVGVRDGVTYVDDSKATNPHAAAAALHAFDAILWIAGGLAKGVDLTVLSQHLQAVRHAFLIGEAADQLLAVCRTAGVPAEVHGSIESAVAAAADAARVGDTVLLSPACASFDQFRDYADRGDRFAAAARDREQRDG